MSERTHKKRPRDPNQLGKMIVDISVGDIEDRRVAIGHLGVEPVEVIFAPIDVKVFEEAKKAAYQLWIAPK